MAGPKLTFILPAIFAAAIFISGCGETDNSIIQQVNREPVIEPDYSGVIIPYNIAPMNFLIAEEGKNFLLTISSSSGIRKIIRSSDGNVIFPAGMWRALTENNKGGVIEIEVIGENKEKRLRKFDPFMMKVSGDAIDPWLCYRLLYPGYESWVEMKIVRRSTESFKEESLVENQLLDENCINCHSFCQNQPDRFLLHVRGSRGGTYFIDGSKITRKTLKTENMKANTVYPAWHPSGKYVAFSSNKTVQSFHMLPGKNIEVLDLYSSVLLYNTVSNSMSGLPQDDTVKYMETFPCWSPDGNYLYYCRSVQAGKDEDIRNVRYDLVRRSFDPSSRIFGNAEVVFEAKAAGRSVSFPSISPDGNYLVMTLHDYGTFSIWHREADLYLLDLKSHEVSRLSVNSDETESYHGWSSDGRWLVFSSKRGDGLTARPYFAWFTPTGTCGKPFVLPQKDPGFYKRFPKTFNRPELVTGKGAVGPRDFMKVSRKLPVKAVWAGN